MPDYDISRFTGEFDLVGMTEAEKLAFIKANQSTNPQTVTATDTVITAYDEVYFGDVTDSTKLKKDTVQGILDLVPAPDLTPYAKLDGSNQPFTGDVTIQKATASLNVDATSAVTGYTSNYPPAYNSTYVKATTTYYEAPTYYWSPYLSCDPSKSLISSWAGGGSAFTWLASAPTNQRFHIDLGTAKTIRRIYYENQHNKGSSTNTGAKTFTFWGSNSGSAFADTTYGVDANWTQLTTSQGTFDQHVALQQVDPKYITVTNNNAYRYYAVKISDNWGSGLYIGLRRIELQTEDSSATPTIYLKENSETKWNISSDGADSSKLKIKDAAGTTQVAIDQTTGDTTFNGDISAANLSGENTGDQDLSGYLTIDQTTPQTIINGTPNFKEGLLSDDTGTFDFNTGTFGVPVTTGLHTTTTSDAGGFNVVSVNQINATDIATMSTTGGLGFINRIDGGASWFGPSTVYGVFGFNSLYNGGYASGMVGGEFQSNITEASIADTATGIVGSVTAFADSNVDTAYGSKIGISASGTDAVIGTAYGYYADLFSGNGGVITNAYGYYATDVNKATNNYAIYTNLGDVSFGDDLILRNDNDKIWFGTGKDASIYYNGTNLVINPKEVGTGYLDLVGVIRTTAEDYSLFGDTTGMNSTILPLTGRDRLYSAISSGATSGNIRAGFFAGNFSGTSSSSLNVNGVNAFANTLSSSTGDLTATNQGGGLRSRYAIRHDGKGTVALASTITANIQANGGNITTGSLYNAEKPSVAGGKTIGDLAGFRVTGGTVAGTITTWYGLKVDSLLGGTTRWGVYVDADDSFFGGKVAFTQTDGNEYIDSLADGYMDYGATTQHRFNNDVDVDGDITADAVLAVHRAADGTAAVADGTYTVGIGGTTNGTITIKDGIITAVQEAVA